MEKAFYDYKKRKYEILDAVGQNDWQLYLVQSPNGKYYIVNSANKYFKESAKPLRSVFNKYLSSQMYDIPNVCQELQNSDLLEYERQKYEVISYDVGKKQELEMADRRNKATASGWTELNADNATFAVNGETLSVLVDGKQFEIKQRSAELSFNSLTEAELKAYGAQWIDVYNYSVANLAQAQTSAECKILADRKVAQWVNEGKTSSLDLTSRLVEHLDISEKYEGYQSDKAFAVAVSVLEYMEGHSIPFASEPTLMGDCNDLKYDMHDVLCQHQIYNSECREEAIITQLEAKALSFLESKKLLPLNAATQGEKKYTKTYDIPNSDNLDLTAKCYQNEAIGTECYDIVLKSKYPYFDTKPRVIGSCGQMAISGLIGISSNATGEGVHRQVESSATTSAPKSRQHQNQM